MTMVTYTRTTATVIVETVNITALEQLHIITLHRHKRSDYYFKHTTTEHQHQHLAAIQTETGHDYYFDINMVIVSPARRM